MDVSGSALDYALHVLELYSLALTLTHTHTDEHVVYRVTVTDFMFLLRQIDTLSLLAMATPFTRGQM